MAMRFQRRARRFVGRRPKTPVSWVTTLFNETAVNVTAAASVSQVLLDDDDWRGDIASLRQVAHIRRIVYSGVVMWIPQSTTDAGNMVSLVWACAVVDASEGITAATLNSTAAGSLWQEKRVLQGGIVGWGAIETTGGFLSNQVDGFPVEFDLRTNVLVNPGSNLEVAFCYQSDASSSVAVTSVSALSRVLIVTP